MNRAPLAPSSRERLALRLLIPMAAIAFVFPFLTVTAAGREGTATGVELVRGEASYSGQYVHAAFEGEVESLVANGRLPARATLVVLLLGLGVAWLPGPRGFVATAGAAGAGLLTMAWFQQVTSPPFSPPNPDLRYGFWLTLVLLVAAAVYGVVLYRRDRRWRFERDEGEGVELWPYAEKRPDG